MTPPAQKISGQISICKQLTGTDTEVVCADLSRDRLLGKTAFPIYQQAWEADKKAYISLRRVVDRLQRFLLGEGELEAFKAEVDKWSESDFSDPVNAAALRRLPKILMLIKGLENKPGKGSNELQSRADQALKAIQSGKTAVTNWSEEKNNVQHDADLQVLNRPRFVFEPYVTWMGQAYYSSPYGDRFYNLGGFGLNFGVSNPRDSDWLFAFKTSAEIYPDTQGRAYFRSHLEWDLGYGNDVFGLYLIGRPFNFNVSLETGYFSNSVAGGLGVYFGKRAVHLRFVPDFYGNWTGAPLRSDLEVDAVDYAVNATVDIPALLEDPDPLFPKGASSKLQFTLRPAVNGLVGHRGEFGGLFMVGPGLEAGITSPTQSPLYWSTTVGFWGAFGEDVLDFNSGREVSNAGINFAWKGRVGTQVLGATFYYAVGTHWLTDSLTNTAVMTPFGLGGEIGNCGLEWGAGFNLTRGISGPAGSLTFYCDVMPWIRHLGGSQHSGVVQPMVATLPLPAPIVLVETPALIQEAPIEIPQKVDTTPVDPAPKVEIKENHIVLIDQQVNFETDKADLTPGSPAVLDQVVEVLKKNPQIRKVQIQGHTDRRIPPQGNQKLSEDRENCSQLSDQQRN